ncbi:pyruvate kinase [bacterium]|nr:pyruvate kinase [bacterium]
MKHVHANRYKKTKIIATIGPASEAKIDELLAAGVNGIRLNLSHNTHEWHARVISKVRTVAKKLDRSVAIIWDLQGPKIRIGEVEGIIEVKAGDQIKLAERVSTGSDVIPMQYDIAPHVKVGDRVMIRDGVITTEVTRVQDGVVTVRAENAGKFGSNHGVNLPDTIFHGSKLTDKDMEDLRFGLARDIDYIALSFVHTVEDIEMLKAMIRKRKKKIRVIAKIETKSATENLHSIVSASDAVMIARGDLALETSPETVPIIGRRIIEMAREYKTPVIMATQMLDSMTSSPTPTRAEANDVATAVSLGVDAVMLSGETAIGAFPIETVKMMKRIILSTEQYMRDSGELKMLSRDLNAADDAQDAVAVAALTLGNHVGAQLILAETLTGTTAQAISALRPDAAIIMASPDVQVCNQLAIVWGSKPYKVPRRRYIQSRLVKALVKRGALRSGDYIVSAFGTHAGKTGATDTVRLLVA